jgi:Protein of unknown function (DUF4232)
MKLSTRLSRRLVAGVGIASAAVLLPTAALASSAGTSAASRAAVAGCTSVNTRVWYGLPFEGTAGHFFYQLQFSNIGHSTCSFFGYPGVSTLDANGHQVGLPATHSGSRLTVTLAPGATGHVVLEVTDAGAVCAHPVKTVTLRVFPPNQFHAQLVPFPSQACPGKSVLHVDAMHPRAGIPGFSTS